MPHLFCLLLGLLLLAGPALAQTPAARSLPTDTTQVWALLRAVKAAGPSQQPQALAWAGQARQAAQRLHFTPAEAEANLLLGRFYRNQGRAAEATRCLQAAVKLAEGPPRRAGTLFLATVALGQTASITQAFAEAQHYLQQAEQVLATCSPAHQAELAYALHGSWASLYYQWAEEGTAPAGAGRQALRYSRLALREARASHDSVRQANALTMLSNSFAYLKQSDSAVYYLEQQYRLERALGNVFGEALTLGNLAITRLDQRRWAQAVVLARRSIHLDSGRSGPQHLGHAYAVLCEALPHLQEWAAAFRIAEAYLALQDSVHTLGQALELSQLRVSFDTERKEARIRALEADRLLTAQAQELARLRTQRERIGFGALGVLALLVGGGLFWKVRRRQATRETSLRTQLAADLHDDVGTLLSQISMQSGVLQEGLADPANQRQQLDQIGEASRNAVRQLNDVVWSLDAHNDHFPDLLDRMRDYAEDLLPPTGLALSVTAPTDLPTRRLPVLLRRNLYLIYKEALHNVIKHAYGATQVAVVLRPAGDELLLEIADNGQPRPATGPAPRRTGHGLRNIAQRAAAVGGTAEATARPDGPGFRVQIRVPLVGN